MTPEPSTAGERSRLAASDTLLSLLQRGRGAGYLQALQEPPEIVRSLLLRCLTEGPISDCDARAGYLARLILHTGLELEPLAAFLREHDTQDLRSPAKLARDTLVALAVLDHAPAAAILHDYVGWGCEWNDVLSWLEWYGRQDLFAGWGDAIVRRCEEAESPLMLWLDLSLIRGAGEEPWSTWRRRCPVLDEALAGPTGAESRHTQDHAEGIDPALAALSYAELFELVASERGDGEAPEERRQFGFPLTAEQSAAALRNQQAGIQLMQRAGPQHRELLLSHLSAEDKWRCTLALGLLRWSRDPDAVPVLQTFLESNPEMPPVLRLLSAEALGSLPGARVLWLSREWIDHPDLLYRKVAAEALEHEATPQDLPTLRAAVLRELEAGEKHNLCALLRAFQRFPDIGRVPELERVYAETADSLLREYVVGALVATGPGYFAAALAREALWDAGSGTRMLAARVVPLHLPGVMERLVELREGPLTDGPHREHIAGRLEQMQAPVQEA